MRILVINPNASVEMTCVIREQLHTVARADVDVDVVNPPTALPPAIESAIGRGRLRAADARKNSSKMPSRRGYRRRRHRLLLRPRP